MERLHRNSQDSRRVLVQGHSPSASGFGDVEARAVGDGKINIDKGP